MVGPFSFCVSLVFFTEYTTVLTLELGCIVV